MTKVKGHSLWLMPSEDVYNKLAKIIFRLSKKYSAPNFEPHVTLIGELIGSKEDILFKTSQLASIVKPYRIELAKVECLDEYFRCLLIRVKETDNVMNANSKARKIFKRQNDPKYMPHLSLIYGNFPLRTKEEIITEIGKEFNFTFEVESIHLFSTNGEPKDWYKVKAFTLK